jgi:hypothetical protein
MSREGPNTQSGNRIETKAVKPKATPRAMVPWAIHVSYRGGVANTVTMTAETRSTNPATTRRSAGHVPPAPTAED